MNISGDGTRVTLPKDSKWQRRSPSERRSSCKSLLATMSFVRKQWAHNGIKKTRRRKKKKKRKKRKINRKKMKKEKKKRKKGKKEQEQEEDEDEAEKEAKERS